jgi:hypothetical protein
MDIRLNKFLADNGIASRETSSDLRGKNDRGNLMKLQNSLCL